METVVSFLYLALALMIYALPAIIAKVRWHRNFMAIAALNITLGWSLIGWLIAFIWSLTDNTVEIEDIISDEPFGQPTATYGRGKVDIRA